MHSNWSYTPEAFNSGQKSSFVWSCDLEIWRMAWKNNREYLLCHFKICVSFRSDLWFETGVTIRKLAICVKIVDSAACVTLIFERWPWKTVGHFFYTTSSFVNHLVVFSELKPELQSGNKQIGAKFILTSITLAFDFWPWPFAWILRLSMAITHKISRWYDDGNIVKRVWLTD